MDVSLTNIDLSNFNTKNITDMSIMFNKCSYLVKLDLYYLNTQNVTDMSHMFYSCISLTNIDLSSFNTEKVTNISYMFKGCISLTNIDISSNFKIKDNTDKVFWITKNNQLNAKKLRSLLNIN